MNLHYITLHYTILHDDITWLRQIVYLLSYLLAYLRAYLLTYLVQDPTSIAEATSMTSIVNESSIWRYRLSRAIRWSNGRITHLKTARAVCKKLPLLGQSNRWQDGASILRRGRMLTKVQGHVCYSSKLVSSPVESLANACHSTCRERMMLQKTARPWSACRLLCHPSAERCRHALGGRRVEEWEKWIEMGALSTSRRSIVSCFVTLYRLASTNVSTFTEQSAEGRVRVCQGGKVIQPASAMATVMSCKNTLIITNYCSQDFWVRILPYK